MKRVGAKKASSDPKLVRRNRRMLENRKDREAVFYLFCEPRGHLTKTVWFVNNSDEMLSEVFNSSGGFATAGDEILGWAADTKKSRYCDVMPGEVVPMDIYHELYDSDFVTQWSVTVSSPSLGTRTFETVLGKGKEPNVTLRWSPLPAELTDPEEPDRLLAPETAAAEALSKGARRLPRSVPLNRGDLMQDYAASRLAPFGVKLKKTPLRDGARTCFEFFVETGEMVFRTTNPARATAFVAALREL